MAEQTRGTVLAIKEEVTEGTPVLPSAGTDFIALQDGFELAPSFNLLENNEIRSSIGKAKSITGLENPTASLDHYVRHSGVEGQEPNFGSLLEAAFGSVEVESTQYDTVPASTTSVVKVDVAEGATFSRGQALLVKDGTNGYSIRPVFSIASDDLTLGFNLANAPASGVNLGKAVRYYPANSGHKSLTLTNYRANGGALEVIAGAKVNEMKMDVTAGELIKGSFSMQGIKYYFDPINIGATDTKLDFVDDDGTHAATIPSKLYRDPHELAQAIQDAMLTANTGKTPTVLYVDSSGKFTIKTTGTVLTLKFGTGVNLANSISDKIGFTAADKSGTAATTGYTSDTAQSWAASLTPSYDNSDPLVAKNNEVLLGDSADSSCFCASSLTFTLSNNLQNIPCVCSESGVSGAVVNGRAVTVEIVGLLERHDAEKFKRFRANDETSFLFNFGTKSGGNWVAGKCGMLYIPTATISSFKLGDQDGLVTVEMTLTAFVDSSGNGEVYLNFV